MRLGIHGTWSECESESVRLMGFDVISSRGLWVVRLFGFVLMSFFPPFCLYHYHRLSTWGFDSDTPHAQHGM